jgi:hypothetical protein
MRASIGWLMRRVQFLMVMRLCIDKSGREFAGSGTDDGFNIVWCDR